MHLGIPYDDFNGIPPKKGVGDSVVFVDLPYPVLIFMLHPLIIIIIELRHVISKQFGILTSVDADEPVQPPC